MKSLNNFPKPKTSSRFNPDNFGHDVRLDVGQASPYAGLFGLEFELEGRGLPANVSALGEIDGISWVGHEDGSLRNGGREYVLSQPCSLQQVGPLCDMLFGGLHAAGAVINNSYRCSTHVHVNMRGVKINRLASFVTLWGMFEDVLSAWCGDHRAGNLFALRMSDCDGAVTAWIEAFRTGYFEFSRDRRYLAMNPASLNTFGSLEIRTMRGVEGTPDVLLWVSAINRLFELSKEYNNPQDIATAFSGVWGEGMFRTVFDGMEITPQLIEKSPDYGKLVTQGFRRVQPIVYTLPWGDVLPEIEKVFVPNPWGTTKFKKPPMALGIEELRPVQEWHDELAEEDEG